MGKTSVLGAAVLSSLLCASCAGSDPERSDGSASESTAPDDVAAAPADAERTATGLAWKQLVAGQGERRPGPTDIVRVHYTGWKTDGMEFESSRDRAPSEFALNEVIAGWTEGLQLMVEGEQRRFWIPEDLAYGGARNRPSGMLVFDVELIAIVSL